MFGGKKIINKIVKKRDEICQFLKVFLFLFLLTQLISCYFWVKFEDLDKSNNSSTTPNIEEVNQKKWNIQIQIGNGSTFTNHITNSVILDAPSAQDMSLTLDLASCLSSKDWQEFKTNNFVNLVQLNQVNQVCVKFRDSNLEESQCICENIIHDSLTPLQPDNLKIDWSESTLIPKIVFTESTDRGLSGINKYQTRVVEYSSGNTYSDWIDLSISSGSFLYANFDLSNITSGTNYQFQLRVIDSAGNVSPTILSELWGSKFLNKPLKEQVSYPMNMIIADLDLDGESDVSIFSQESNNIYWHKNSYKDKGYFNDAKKIISEKINGNSWFNYSFSNYSFVKFDTDGALDLITWSSLSNKYEFKMYKNELKDNGLFTEVSNFNLESNDNSYFIFSDLNNDGKDDFIISEGSQIFWQQNVYNANSDTYFLTTQLLISMSDNVSEFKVVDVNQDTRLDFLVQVGTSSQWVLINNLGNLSFSIPYTVISNATGRITDVLDLDGDGFLDLIQLGGWYKNNGSNQIFSSFISFGISFQINYFNSQVFSDLDKDGDLDFLVGEYLNEEIKFYKNNGDGTFTYAQSVFSLPPGQEIFGFQLNDLDSDGDKDLIYYLSDPSNSYYIYYDHNTNLFLTNKNNLTLTGNDATVGKIDSDSINDIIIASDIGIYGFLNDKNFPGKLGESIKISSDKTSLLSADDIDGDGRDDVVGVFSDISNSGKSNLVWYKNLGNNQYSTAGTLASGFNAVNVFKVVDFDNDSKLDIVYMSQSSSLIAWVQNLGGGVFSSQKVISNLYNTGYDLDAGDFDSDGDKDLIISTTIAGGRWFRFDSNTLSFSNSIQLIASCWKDISVGDFDLNGFPDLACSWNDKFYLNNSGSFGAGLDISTLGFFNDIIVIDFDKDNKLDLLAIENNSKIYFMKNKGSGLFESPELIFTGTKYYKKLKPVNLDLDSALEILAIDTNDGIELLEFK